jgi:hypothetical protein
MKDNKKNNTFLEYFKVFIYGVVTPAILSYGFYYTFSEAVKTSVKEALIETLNISIKTHIKNRFDKKLFS